MSNAVSYGDEVPKVVNTIIEITEGSALKIEVDPETGQLWLDRVQPNHLRFPGNYAEIPDTLAEDGDPLDAIVLCGQALPMGLAVQARVVGVMHMVDDGDNDQKIICVPKKDKNSDHIQDIDDVPEHWKKSATHFFEHYKDLKSEEKVVIEGWGDTTEAYEIITEAIERAKQQ